ncbi:uncharacterized protein LOC128868398 isoform X1 [Anastrepha ludens]|uniref:uncharacterized protein LOC128868398 isoform X1 n=1 Tax=Anastrepha ludens TaxID=28586 RepID=UPI0023AFA54F|nr:uncharacterized protein LOC128868398 isoform X1 [Anastrepha ludens]XP_053966432.1 uncharacterized protein LOC128868398 isoform X1 [Anastrepha ludens]
MNFFVIGFLIMQAARLACGTCVFESEFGFILNCNFKKSGLFRVRNLGGLKAHFGLGFSLGDELGFAESLGNVEGEPERRRAISYKNGPPPSNAAGVLPATQLAPGQHPIPDKRIGARASPTYSATYRENVKRPAAPKQLMTEARPLPLGVPAFRPIPKTATVPVAQIAQRRTNIAVDTTNPRVRLNNKLVESYSGPVNSNRTFHVANPTVSQPIAVPVFQAMPSSVARLAAATKSIANAEERIMHSHPNYLQFEEPKFDLKDVTVEELASAANVTVDTIKHAIYVREQQMKAEHRAMLAAKLRQEFVRTSTTARTTTTTTPVPVAAIRAPVMMNWPQAQDAFENQNVKENVAFESKMSKVMNAPREYYPVGYDKNFDDNFKSKVDLPPTSFSCGKQKHFPGLYADTDLGCMVFHVCALTDDGLVRKSFLCPENTLFDQTILKCNWWFYVDCSTSKSVYDSNIPISKSYQLMKSLTYFSKYNQNSDNDGGDGGLDIQTLKDSMAEEENGKAHRFSEKARSFIIRADETTAVPEQATNSGASAGLETESMQLIKEVTPTASNVEEITTEDIITPQPIYDRLAELKAKLDSIKAAHSQLTTEQTNEA